MALEVDSEEDSTEPKSPLSPLSSDAEKNEEKRETFPPSPELTCTRSQSASSACEPNTKVKHHLNVSHTHQMFPLVLILQEVLSEVVFFVFNLFPCLGIG